MQELADASYNGRDFVEIMDILDKRLNDSGKNWRHVFKALAVLDYLIHSGSEQVVAYAKQNLYVIKTLKEFQYIDEEGKDQGLNVREKSKQIAALLADDDRLKDERKQRTLLRDRMAGASSFTAAGSDVFRPTPSTANRIAPSSAYEEQSQLERAIEESKRAAAEHERRLREREAEDRELQKALEISRREQRQQPQPQPQVQQTQQLDLWGSQDQKKNDLDFFASMAAPQPVAQTQPDPFGIQPAAPQQQAFFHQQSQQSFAAFSSNDQGGFGQQPFAQQSQPFGQQLIQQQQQPFGGNAFSQPPLQQQQSAFGNAAFGTTSQPAMSNAFGGNAFASAPAAPAQGGFGFDSAFDTGAGQKNFVPRSVQGLANPNAQLAQIARNAVQIDPFASMAASNPVPLNKASTGLSNTDLNWGGPTLQPTSTSIQPASSFGQPAQQPKSNNSDPFASLVPFTSKPPQPAPSLASQSSSVSMGQPMMSRQASGNPFGQQQQPFGQPQQPFGYTGGGFGGQSQQFGQQQQQQRPPAQQQNFFF